MNICLTVTFAFLKCHIFTWTTHVYISCLQYCTGLYKFAFQRKLLLIRLKFMWCILTYSTNNRLLFIICQIFGFHSLHEKHYRLYRQLRARRALLPYTLYSNSALLVLKWRYVLLNMKHTKHSNRHTVSVLLDI